MTDRGHVSSVLGRYRWPTWVNRHGFTKALRKPVDGLRSERLFYGKKREEGPLSPSLGLHDARFGHRRRRLHRLPPVRAPARRGLGGVRPRRPLDGRRGEYPPSPRTRGLPPRRRLGALPIRRQRARAPVRCRLPPRGRCRSAPDRRAARPDAADERPGRRERARVLRPLREAGAGRLELRGVRQPPGGRLPRRERAADLRADDCETVGVRGHEGARRVPRARPQARARSSVRDRSPLQHRRPPPVESVRERHSALRPARTRRRAARGPRRRLADALLLPCLRRRARPPRAAGARGRRDLQRRVDRPDHDPRSSPSASSTATGSSSELVFVPYEEVYEGGVAEEMFHRAPAIDKITRAIGWRPTIDLDDIIADVVRDARARAGQAPSPT